MCPLKDVKAMVRPECVADLIHDLENAGVQRVYVSHVHAFGAGVDLRDLHPSMDEGEAYTEKAKVEFVCAAEEVDSLAALIRGRGCTGHRGDGVVIVSDVSEVVSVRTGERDGLALL